MGVLPCPGRVNAGHGRGRDRTARTFRAWVPGRGGGDPCDHRCGMASYNRNYIGGDFSAGIMDVRGLLQRPVVSPVPWRTPVRGVYLCSSSTPPGPGVTGMPGFFAAKYALKDIFGLKVPALGL